MIADLEIHERFALLDGLNFGDTGPYEMLRGVAHGVVDPTLSSNQIITGLDLAPRGALGVAYCTDICLLRPLDPARGAGKLLHEVNNRGRKLIFSHICGGAGGNIPRRPEDVGSALPLRMGFTLSWCGWDPAAPRADAGLAMDCPIAMEKGVPLARIVREEFISGTRRGTLTQFRLTYDAADLNPARATLRVRPNNRAPSCEVAWEYLDASTIRLLPVGTLPEIGAIYDFTYPAHKTPILGLGFAATRDWVSFLRHDPRARDLLGGDFTHAIGYGSSQAGRFLRDHVALGFNHDEAGNRVFDGIQTHVASIGRATLNLLFGQPNRTRTQHEDHGSPEIIAPFATRDLLRGDGSDPLIIESNTGSEYWQKGASLLHTNRDATQDLPEAPGVRSFYVAGTQHTGQPAMKIKSAPMQYAANPHDPTPLTRALFVALDAWVTTGKEPPRSVVPRIANGTLVAAENLAFPNLPGIDLPYAPNDATIYADMVTATPEATYPALLPQVDADGNDLSGVLLPEIAVPRATHVSWNLYRAPLPDGEMADRDGMCIPFARTRAERDAVGDPRLSLAERYDAQSYIARIDAVVACLEADRLLLAEDAARYRQQARDLVGKGNSA